MNLNKGSSFRERDIYIDYDFEDVKFKWDHKKEIFYRKFDDDSHESIVPHDNRLLNDAILYGDEITKEEYEKTND